MNVLRRLDRGAAAPRRTLRLAVLGAAVLLAACRQAPQAASTAELPSAPAPIPTAPVLAVPAVSATPAALPPTAPPPSAAAAPAPTIALPSAMPAPPEPSVIDAAPFATLRDVTIVDRPASGMRALTDGERLYRLALWSPNSSWIAAVPQDGPGMDLVDADTGAVLAVTDDTFVLEPVWVPQQPGDGEPCLLLHLVEDEGDRLDLVYVEGAGRAATLRRETVFRSPLPLRAPAYASGTLAYAVDGRFVLAARDALAYPAALPGAGALSAALSPDAERPSVAWTPWATVLTDVETLVQLPGEERPYALTTRGEGWWMPRWAPGGDRLALISVEGRVGTAAVNGSARFDLGPGIDPAWSPDGDQVAFAGQGAGDEYTSRDIFVVDWQAAGPRLRLTRADEDEIFVSPSWSPDGARIAFVEIDSGHVFVAEAP